MIIFQKKSFKPVETLILLLYLSIMITSSQPDLLKIYWWGKYNIYAAYIFIKFLVGVLYKKNVFFGFLQPVFYKKQSIFLSYFLVNCMWSSSSSCFCNEAHINTVFTWLSMNEFIEQTTWANVPKTESKWKWNYLWNKLKT